MTPSHTPGWPNGHPALGSADPRGVAGQPLAPALQGFDHVHVDVADRTAALHWYARVLGFAPVAALQSWAVDGGPLTIGDAAGRVHLALFERVAPPGRGATVAFATDADGFIAWQRHLAQALGRDIAPVDHALSWSLYFSDPDGNGFEITSYAHAALARHVSAAGAG